MPRPAKGARLWYDKSTALWYIRDGSIKRGTGCGLEERQGAEKALAAYVEDKYEPPRDSRASRLLVADVLTFYSREVATKHRSQAASYAVEALLAWWGTRPLSDVKKSTCRAYVEHRISSPIAQARTEAAKKRKVRPETPRRELAVLRAAINAYHKETPLDALPVVSLPAAAQPRARWLSRKEAARLLRGARAMGDKEAARALVRFILIGLYTGTRSGAIRDLGWMPNTVGGHVDLEARTIHRRGADESESRKRRPPARIPDRIFSAMERWREDDMGLDPPMPFVVHYRGQRVEKQRRSWAAACKAAGLGADVTPHILRHTAVTWMMLAGNEPYDVAAYVGMSATMLEDVYGHHHPDHQQVLASRIGRR